jgi:hypothetical protein
MTELAHAGHHFFRLRSAAKKREGRPREELDEQGMDRILNTLPVSSHGLEIVAMSMEQ